MPATATDTDDKIKLSASETRVWVLGGGAALLLLLAQSLLTYIISSAAGDIKITNEKLTKLASTVEVEAVRNEALRQRVADLEASRAEAAKHDRDVELRLNSLEQRAAVHDQFLTTHH